MKNSIKSKILPIIIIFAAFLSTIFFILILLELNSETERRNRESIQQAKKTFDNLVEEEVKMLKLGLIDMMENKEIKNIFLEKNRDKLYEYVKPIFERQKNELGVTHWLFHEPDKNVFLRVHSPELFGMPPQERRTFTKAEKTKSWGIGMELGSRGFALRVVHPYYKDGSLVGYMEYGEEINHFSESMKQQTGNNFAMIAKKASIDAKGWEGYRQSVGLRDNYNDMQNYVLLGATEESLTSNNKCLVESLLEGVTEEGVVFNEFESGGKNYICGGFSLIDAKDEKAGVIIVARDITAEKAEADKTKYLALTISILAIILIVFVLVIIMDKIIVAPLKKLTNAANEISEKNLWNKIDIKNQDELGMMASAFNNMTAKLKAYQIELEKGKESLEIKVEERTKELKDKINELERFQTLTVGRELKMAELKKQIEEKGQEKPAENTNS